MRNRLVTGTALLVGLAATALVLMGSNEPRAARTDQATRVVRVIRVQREPVTTSVQLYGVVRATRRADLSFTIGGRLMQRPVRVGDPVRTGQVLSRLDGRPLINSVRAAAATLDRSRARLAQLRRERRRVRALRTAGAVPVQSLERSQTSATTAAASSRASRVGLREARRQLSESLLRAPFDGTVIAVHLEPGEYATPGKPVVSLAGSRELELELEAPEELVAHMRRGMQVVVDLPLAGRRGIPGVVQSLGHAARGPGQLFPVLVALPPGQPGVLPGMTAEVTLARTEREALVVPVGAVVNPTGSRPALFVVRQRRARRVPIEVQAVTGERLAVRPAPAAGGPTLAPGDRVVVAGQIGLIDDEPVRVARGATRRREVANR